MIGGRFIAVLSLIRLKISYNSAIKIKAGLTCYNFRSATFVMSSTVSLVFWMYNSEMYSSNTCTCNILHHHQSCHGECNEYILTNIRHLRLFTAIIHDGEPTDAQLIK